MKPNLFYLIISIGVFAFLSCNNVDDKKKAQFNARYNNIAETLSFPSPDGKLTIKQFTVDSLMTGLHGDIPFYIHNIKVEDGDRRLVLEMKAPDFNAQNLKFVKWLTNDYALVTDAGVFGIEAFFLYNRKQNEVNSFKYNIGIEISRLELSPEDKISLEVDGEKNIYKVETDNVIITEEGRVDAKKTKNKAEKAVQ